MNSNSISGRSAKEKWLIKQITRLNDKKINESFCELKCVLGAFIWDHISNGEKDEKAERSYFERIDSFICALLWIRIQFLYGDGEFIKLSSSLPHDAWIYLLPLTMYCMPIVLCVRIFACIRNMMNSGHLKWK